MTIFDGTLDSQVINQTCSDVEAEACGEFIERLVDDGMHTGLIVIAHHGGNIEQYTNQQAERVALQLVGKDVSFWQSKGWHPKGAFAHWHITSTYIHEASFPFSTRSSPEIFDMLSPSMASKVHVIKVSPSGRNSDSVFCEIFDHNGRLRPAPDFPTRSSFATFYAFKHLQLLNLISRNHVS